MVRERNETMARAARRGAGALANTLPDSGAIDSSGAAGEGLTQKGTRASAKVLPDRHGRMHADHLVEYPRAADRLRDLGGGTMGKASWMKDEAVPQKVGLRETTSSEA